MNKRLDEEIARVEDELEFWQGEALYWQQHPVDDTNVFIEATIDRVNGYVREYTEKLEDLTNRRRIMRARSRRRRYEKRQQLIEDVMNTIYGEEEA